MTGPAIPALPVPDARPPAGDSAKAASRSWAWTLLASSLRRLADQPLLVDIKPYCQLMARYNEWMNLRLYALLATRPESELHLDRGAFFKSIYLTLNHIAYADLAFLSRMTGTPRNVPMLGVDLFGSFHALRVERESIDGRLLRWAETLAPGALVSSVGYASQVDGSERTMPRWALAVHAFNHQTHHRAQVLTVLTQMGLDVGPTDIAFMPQFRALEPAL